MLSRIVDGQPPQMRELFHYAIVMLMTENGKAKIIERRTVDAREWITVRTTTPEIFSITVPNLNDERFEVLREATREVLEEEMTK